MSLIAQALDVAPGRDTFVRNVSCEAIPGQLTVLIGPNGSGKTTLLRCLAGALAPRAGRVLLGGNDLYRLSPKQVAARLAFVPQNSPIGFAFTVRELVALGALAPAGQGSQAESVRQALRHLELDALADRSLLRVSGGERQRAAVARGLAQNVSYLLLDEPTAHLDLRHQTRLLRRLQHNAHVDNQAVLAVLHDINLAAAHADTLLLMAEGRIVAQGTPSFVLTLEHLQAAYQTPVWVGRHPVNGRPWVTGLPSGSSPAAAPGGP